MESNLCTVKNKAYHHGDLRRVLIETAVAVLTDKGVDGFSLRETARRAGVSPGAPKHHFGDTRALLTAIAADSFKMLEESLEAAARSGKTKQQQLAAQGEAYVTFALDNPARFDLMWRAALLDQCDPVYVAAGDRAFSSLDRLVRGKDAPACSRTDPAMAPTIACWSIVHGLVRLTLDGAFGPLHEMTRAAINQTAINTIAQLTGRLQKVIG